MVVVVFALLIFGTSPGIAQQPDEPVLRVVTRQDGAVYIYHTGTPALGYGFNIYRKGASEADSMFVKLNEEPVVGARSEAEFRALLGSRLYAELRSRFTETSSGIFLSLRGNTVSGLLYTFVYPEVARALTRLYMDTTATQGQEVTYRVIFADPFGQETEEEIMRSVLLEPQKPVAPSGLRAENNGRFMKLFWTYPKNEEGEDDKVIRFNIYRRSGATDEFVQLNTGPIIRNEAADELSYSFEVLPTDTLIELMVRAYDITGQPGPDSRILRYSITDNQPPSFITGVQALADSSGTVFVSWPVSVEADVVGYYIYRAESVQEDAPLTKLNEEPLGLLQTVFRDTTLVVTSPQIFAYRITAVDAAGNESEPSNAVTVPVKDFVPPPAPLLVQAEYLDDGTVLVSWQAPPMPIDFQTYVVMRKMLDRRAAPVPTRINVDNLRNTSIVDANDTGGGFIEGASYRYTVAAVDSARNAGDSVVTVLVIPNLVPPDPPGAFRARNDNGIRAELAWSQPYTPDLEYFTIYRSALDTAQTEQFQVSGNELSYSDESVNLAATYRYRITATDSAGNESLFSVADTVFVRNYLLPRSVRNVRAQAMEEGVRITWEPVPDPDLAGYRVFRSSIATGVFEPVSESLIEGTEFTDPSGQAGLWYQVRAYNTSTNESRPSEPVQAGGQP